jgi:ubiquitin-protein ligase
VDSAKKLLASHSKGRMAGLNLGDFSPVNLRIRAMMEQYKSIQSCLPRGMYMKPDAKDLMRLHGFLYVRSSTIYEKNALTFLIDIPHTFPADGAMPSVYIGTRLPHPLVHPDVRQQCHTVCPAHSCAAAL